MGDHLRGMAGMIAAYLNWLEAGSVSEQTVRLRETHLNRFSRTHDLETADSEVIVDFLRRRGWKPNTVKSFRSSLAGFYEWAVKTKRLTDNPMDDVRPIRMPPAVPKIASAAALDEALTNANSRDRLAVKLAAYAGLRRAEIAALKCEDIEEGWLRVAGKGGKVRRVPIHPQLINDIARLEGRRGYIFPDRWGEGHVTDDAMGRRIARLLPEGMTAHSLRHLFATSAYRGSHDLRAVQQLLGHSSLSTTQVYVHTDDDELKAAVFGVA